MRVALATQSPSRRRAPLRCRAGGSGDDDVDGDVSDEELEEEDYAITTDTGGVPWRVHTRGAARVALRRLAAR